MDAMLTHIHHLVHVEQRLFSYLDFIRFEVDGQEYKIAHGTFRNYIPCLMKEGLVEVSYKSNITFYTLRGVKFDRASRIVMTCDHTGVFFCHYCHYCTCISCSYSLHIINHAKSSNIATTYESRLRR